MSAARRKKNSSPGKKEEYMGGITARQALEAYNMLVNYCSTQGSCGNCLPSMGEDNDCGDCIMEIQSEPRRCQALDLD